jgi:outer membrane protein assembly factor BamB
MVIGLGVVGVHADDPWPMSQANAQRTGQSSLPGPQSKTTKCTFFPFEGDAVGSPAVGTGGTIYVPSGSLNKAEGFLYALNRNCTQKWKVTLPGAPGATTPAVAANGTVYVHTNGKGSRLGVETLVAINPGGTRKWEFEFNNGAPLFTSDVLSSPVLAGGNIWVGSQDTRLYKLDPDNGRELCSDSPSGSAIDASPAIDGDRVYIVDASTQLFAYNSNCQPQWSFPLGDVGTANPQSPSIGPDGTIYVGSPDDHLYAVYPHGALRCKFQTGGTIKATPAIDNDTVYVASDGLYALHSDTCNLKWKFPDTPVLSSSASPTIGADGTIYWRAGRTAYAINSNGTQKWSSRPVSPGEGLDPSAAIGPGRVLYMSNGGFFAPLSLLAIADGCGVRPPTKVGTEEDDIIRGTDGDDVIRGLGGNDEIHGLGGNDLLCGDEGDDTLYGDTGDDWLVGGDGQDTLEGGPGYDLLRGDNGDDTLQGDPQTDRCDGDAHVDGDRADPTCELIIDVP